MKFALRTEERYIVEFLKTNAKAHFGAVEIAKKAAGRRMFEENPRWAAALLPKLREMGLIEQNEDGQYRYVTEEEREEREKKARKKADRSG